MSVEALLSDDPAEARCCAIGLGCSEDSARLELSGVLVDRVDLDTAVGYLRKFLVCGGSHQIATVNLDFLSLARRDLAFRDTLNSADLVVADGMPLVWASRLRGQPLPHRVTGNELVQHSCRLAQDSGSSVFLLGAAPHVAAAAAERLRAQYPGLELHTYSPPFGPLTLRENEQIIRLIRDADPAFLFVALGAPRQDLWIRDNQDRLRVPVAMGVGCVLDLLAGVVDRAPLWMQNVGLEWAFRFIQEPRRLWKRYFVDDIPMLLRLLASTAWARRRSARAFGKQSSEWA